MKSRKRFCRWRKGVLIQAVLLLSFLFSPAVAYTQQANNDSGAWHFGASIYGWFPEISGQTVFQHESGSDYEVDIENFLESIDFVMMGFFDVRKGRWGLLTDIVYLDLDGSQTGVRGGSIGGNEIPVDASASVDLDLESWIWTLTGYYRAMDQNGKVLDVIAGTRNVNVDQSFQWSLSGNVGEVPSSGRSGVETADVSNWDLIMGIRGRFAFGSQRAWFLPYYLDLGLGESDFTWQGIAGLGYAFKWCEITAVWRYLYYDLSAPVIKDLSLNGPAVGFTFRW